MEYSVEVMMEHNHFNHVFKQETKPIDFWLA